MRQREVMAQAGQEQRPVLVAPETMEAVAAGDRAAFDLLYQRMATPVFSLAMRLLRNQAQAEEVTQEIFLEVWRLAATYTPERGSVQGWVLTITHRRAVDRIRASQASQNRDLRTGIRDFHSETSEDVEDVVEIRMESQRVREAMSHLTQLQRQAVEMTYLEGLSCREVSEQLSVPMSTVKTRLRDGLIRLRDELEVTA
jgi:RNA polymerase sigma-70 factor (ECF subfamily)